MDNYAKSKLNKVRKADRAAYDKKTVHAILDEAFIAHVGFTDTPGGGQEWPMVIPMIYGRIRDTLYLHGAKAARCAKTLGKGVPVCVTVTLVDALVLARSAFHSSMNYRSVVIHGMAHMVSDPDEKTQALAKVTDHLAPGRWDEARPMTPKELRSTSVIAVPMEHTVAKARTGGPIDDDEDYALPIWAGVVPLRQVLEAPQDDGRILEGVEFPASVNRALRRSAR